MMETYEEIYKTICRICLLRGDSDNMVTLTADNCEDGLSSFGKAVKTFAQVSLEKDQGLPEAMCAKCLWLLKQAIYFKLTCASSDNQLRNILKSVHSDMQIFRERIVETIMYGQMFPKQLNEGPKKTSLSVTNSKKQRKSKHENENLTLEFDSDHFDISSPLEESPKKSKLKYKQVLKKLEGLVESNASYHFDFNRKCSKRKKNLLSDQNSMKKDEKILCTICKRVMANRKTYEWHMQRHTGFRYICEHCGKGFPIKHQLQVHQVSKHGTGPCHECPQCSFKAPRKFDLIEHERIHTGERPFACDKCGLTFRRKGIWRRHQVHHAEKTVQCIQCPKKFYRRSEMLAHCNNVHERVYMYSCSKCSATYAKTCSVRQHMTEKHGIPREKQGKVIRITKGSVINDPVERFNNKRNSVNEHVQNTSVYPSKPLK